MSSAKAYGLLAEFDTPGEIYRACEKVRDAGFKIWDSHTPFPVHGLDKAMGLKASKLPFISLVAGLVGMFSGIALQYWTSVIEYPWVVSGKPFFSWPAFVPIIFELAILFGAIGAIAGMLSLNGLPRWHHSLFTSERFEKASDDKFFIAIEAVDPNFDELKTRAFLTEIGAKYVELVNEDES